MKLPLIHLPEVDWAEMLKDFSDADYTHADVARAVNVHFNTIGNYKRGETQPPWSNGNKLVTLYKRVFDREPPVISTTSASTHNI